MFNYGYLFRAHWYKNYLLLGVCAIFITIVSYWELAGKVFFFYICIFIFGIMNLRSNGKGYIPTLGISFFLLGGVERV